MRLGCYTGISSGLKPMVHVSIDGDVSLYDALQSPVWSHVCDLSISTYFHQFAANA